MHKPGLFSLLLTSRVVAGAGPADARCLGAQAPPLCPLMSSARAGCPTWASGPTAAQPVPALLGAFPECPAVPCSRLIGGTVSHDRPREGAGIVLLIGGESAAPDVAVLMKQVVLVRKKITVSGLLAVSAQTFTISFSRLPPPWSGTTPFVVLGH